MRLPEIGGRAYTVAVGLLWGPATFDELVDRFPWETSEGNLMQTLRHLDRRQLIECGDCVRTLADGSTEKAYVYRLTADGKQAILEAAEYFDFLIKKFSMTPAEPVPTIRNFEPRQSPDRPNGDRHPSREELAILLEHAPPELAAPVKIILSCKIRSEPVCGLTVRDFDRMTGSLSLPGRVVRLPIDVADAVAKAINGREAGPLFLRPGRKKPWSASSLKMAFWKARTAAGLPTNLVLIGRKENYRGRQPQSSQTKVDPYRE